MAGESDMQAGRNLFLLTLKGRIAVHFIDGSNLEGEFAAQDELHIFLKLDEGEIIMAPRSQIRYVKGRAGQPVEPDTSQIDFGKAQPAPTAENQADEAETAVREQGGEVVLEPEPETFRTPPPVEDVEGTGVTMVLKDTALLEEIQASTPPKQETGPEDATYVLAPPAEVDSQEARPRLVCTGGPHDGEVYELTSSIVTLGRSNDNAIAMSKDKEISRRHAIIVQEGNRFFIQDQNSLNGTFVNDELIKGSHYLQDGDVIFVGLSTLEYYAT
jgi:predicted component of type VI protein secretion system